MKLNNLSLSDLSDLSDDLTKLAKSLIRLGKLEFIKELTNWVETKENISKKELIDFLILSNKK